MQGIENVFNNENEIVVYVEYLDAKRFTSSEFHEKFFSLINNKYENIDFDIIIVADNAALDFLIKYRDRKIFSAPVVYCGIGDTYNYIDIQRNDGRIFGVEEKENFAASCKMYYQINPYLTDIYVITDTTQANIVFNKEINEVKTLFENKIKIHLLVDYKYQELLDFISKLNYKSDVINYIGVNAINRRIIDNYKFGALVCKTASCPVFSSIPFLLGRGTTGGIYSLGQDQGETCAKIVLSILKGNKTNTIPLITTPSFKYKFDYKLLKKYNIKLSLLPESSEIINLPVNIYTQYKTEFFLLIIFIGILIIIIIILLYNIQKRLKAEKLLIESEKKYSETVNLLPQVVFETDLKGNFTFINYKSYEIFGHSPDEFDIKTKNLADFLIPEEKEHFHESMNLLLKREKISNPVFYAKKKDGSVVPLMISASLIIQNNEVIGIRAIAVDISLQKMIEHELIKAKEKAEMSDKLKSAFLSNVSHEIRTPLNAIIGFSNLMAEKGISDEDRLKYKEIINFSSEHLLKMINDILDFSKIEVGTLEIRKTSFILNTLIEELRLQYELLIKQNNKTIEIKFNIKDELLYSTIYADYYRLKQVLINIIDNSIKFTEKGLIIVSAETENNNILFSVKDTGIGIDPSIYDFIFKRFYKYDNNLRTYPGSGLGLSISKELVELMGGKIWFESTINVGTTFYFTIPVIA
jgi:PAS domain S-box-containing protein